MDPGLDLQPVAPERRTAAWYDVALIFAGANVVATTLVTGGTLATFASPQRALLALGLGLVLGTTPIAVLARVGPRTGLPTMVLLREPFGGGGGAAISVMLILTNFAWIALNNLIAAGALAEIAGGSRSLWVLAAGALATVLALGGPRTMALFDRFAVPVMALVGAAITWALLRRTGAPTTAPASRSFLGALDLVVAYQVSWSLMFADYTRFLRSQRAASLAVFLGLSITSTWLMLVGFYAARSSGGNDPTEMITALGLPAAALAAIALSTLTTNFVNLYLSALALRTLDRRLRGALPVLLVGVVGTALGWLRSDLLDRYAGFMGLLATALLPIVAIALVHFFVRAPKEPQPPPRTWPVDALASWTGGAAAYTLVSRFRPDWGATVPSLLAAAVLYWFLSESRRASNAPGGGS